MNNSNVSIKDRQILDAYSDLCDLCSERDIARAEPAYEGEAEELEAQVVRARAELERLSR